MATTKNTAEIDSVGPNIFIHVIPLEQRYGPRKYIRPSFKQCSPPRLHHFKKSNGIPPVSEKPSPKRGDTKDDYKQGVFYKVVKHQRYGQLEAHRLRHELNSEVRRPFEDIINSDETESSWLDRARANLSYVETRDALLREQYVNNAGPGSQPSSQQGGLVARDGDTERPQRQQAMRRNITLNGQQRRQGLRSSRNVRLVLNPAPQRPSAGDQRRAHHLRLASANETRQAELAHLETLQPSTPVDGQILGVLLGQMGTYIDAFMDASNDGGAQIGPDMTGYEEAFAAYDALNSPDGRPADANNPVATPTGSVDGPLRPGSPVDLHALRARLRDLASNGPPPPISAEQRQPSVQEDPGADTGGEAGGETGVGREDEAEAEAGTARGTEAGEAGPPIIDERIDDDRPLLFTGVPTPSRNQHTYTYSDPVEGWTSEAVVDTGYENPLEARWHDLERYEARNAAVLGEEDGRFSWRTRDHASLTSEERLLRSREDIERRRRDMQRESSRFWAGHEARMAALRLSLRVIAPAQTAAGGACEAALAAALAPVTPPAVERPNETPDAPAETTRATETIELDSDEDV